MNQKPEKPRDEDCCGSGCNPCIFDVYEKQLKAWTTEAIFETNSQLHPTRYSPFRVINIENFAEDTYLYTFHSVNESGLPITSPISLKMGDYVILKGKFINERGLEENISRPYTIILNDYLLQGRFQVLIRLYTYGKMSQYLRNIKCNDDVFWRGPYNKFPHRLSTKHILLLGAGTGIVPLYNIAKTVTMDDSSEALIKIVGCFRSLDSILLRKELYELTAFWNCHVEYFISSNVNHTKLFYKENVLFSKLGTAELTAIVAQYETKDVTVVICGPDSFNVMCKSAFTNFTIGHENVVIL